MTMKKIINSFVYNKCENNSFKIYCESKALAEITFIKKVQTEELLMSEITIFLNI